MANPLTCLGGLLPLPDGESIRLSQFDPDMQCGETSVIVPSALGLLIVSLGTPLVALVMLRRVFLLTNERALDIKMGRKPDPDSEETLGRLEEVMGFLLQGYDRKRAPYWEAVQSMRKGALIAVGTALATFPFVRAVASTAVIIGFLLWQASVQPFATRANNVLDATSSLLLLASVALTVYERDLAQRLPETYLGIREQLGWLQLALPTIMVTAIVLAQFPAVRHAATGAAQSAASIARQLCHSPSKKPAEQPPVTPKRPPRNSQLPPSVATQLASRSSFVLQAPAASASAAPKGSALRTGARRQTLALVQTNPSALKALAKATLSTAGRRATILPPAAQRTELAKASDLPAGMLDGASVEQLIEAKFGKANPMFTPAKSRDRY
jgi:hypothetical protein